jgi:gluconate kinase
MNPGLLKSQLDTLEEPTDDTLTVETTRSPADIVAIIREALNL